MAIPTNNTLPLISGTVSVGETLSCSTGTWTSGPDSYAYQWQESEPGTHPWENVTGATLNTYLIHSGDEGYLIRCVVTATNQDGSASANSLPTIAVPADYLIYEDGTAKSTANSFVSIEDANDYHALRNNESWGKLSVGVRKSLLIKATDYMEQVYRDRWQGLRKTASQALSWPREWVPREDYYAIDSAIPDSVDGTFYYASNVVPTEVKNACADLAYKANSADLSPDIDRVTKREKLGPMEVEYQDYGKPYKTFRNVDNILSVLLKSSGSGVFRKLERV